MGGIEQVNTTGSEFENLQANGVQVYHHNISPDLHHKYAIVDHASPANDPVVITGSHNWSSSAENVNDENTVIVHDPRVAKSLPPGIPWYPDRSGCDPIGGRPRRRCDLYRSIPTLHVTCFLCVGNPMQPLVLWCSAICQDAKCSPQSSVPPPHSFRSLEWPRASTPQVWTDKVCPPRIVVE